MPRPHLAFRFSQRTRPIPPDAAVSPVLRQIADDETSSAIGFDHPLISGRIYFSLPESLVRLMEEEFGSGHFDPQAWELERQLAVDTTRRWDSPGFIDGLPLTYVYLHEPRSLEIPEEWRRAWGMTPEQSEAVCRIGDSGLSRFRVPARGYCGWLLTNPRFLAEHDQLLSRWQGHVYHHGIPGSYHSLTRRSRPEPGSLGAGGPADFVTDFAAFYQRWRLACLEAPYLPCPAVPQVPAPLPAKNHRSVGLTYFLPDTFPVPSREQLRDMLEDALRGGEKPEHLAEWHDVVRSDNRSKHAIERYGRLFALQHFFAVLHFRHGRALQGNRGRLQRVLAAYLFGDRMTGEDTVHKDLVFIRGRLGADWFTAGPSDSDGVPDSDAEST